MGESAAYAIGHIAIKDPEKWVEYRSRVPGTLRPWGAEVVFRGKKTMVLSGAHGHTDTVVIRFPGMGALEGWFQSPAYQALIPLREQAADVVLIAYET